MKNLTSALKKYKGNRIIIESTQGKPIPNISTIINTYGVIFTDTITVTNIKELKDTVILTVTI